MTTLLANIGPGRLRQSIDADATMQRNSQVHFVLGALASQATCGHPLLLSNLADRWSQIWIFNEQF